MSICNKDNNNTITTKARYWVAVCYPENMVDNWQDKIDDLLQVPYAYVVHDKDLDKDGDARKIHVHILFAYSGPTTYRSALNNILLLSDPIKGKPCCNTIQKVQSVRHMYNYLIHDTDNCRKKGKYQYDKDCRVCGNGFDIGSYEQISNDDKIRMRRELSQLIIDHEITNYTSFYAYVLKNYGNEYEEIVSIYSGHFERLTKGNYHIRQMAKEK